MKRIMKRNRTAECGLDSSGSGQEPVEGTFVNMVVNLRVP
jgi:hypothetical protein